MPNTSTLRGLGLPCADIVDALDEDERRWVDTHLRPIVTMATTPTTNTALASGQSHFGGDPHVPEGFRWPTSSAGPLRFVAQIDLADLHDSAATAYYGLPSNGWLLVFAGDEDGTQPGVVHRNDLGDWVEVPDLMLVTYVPAGTPLHRAASQWGGFEQLNAEDYQRLGIEPPSAEAVARAQDNWVCTVSFADSYDLPNTSDVEEPPLTDDGRVDALQTLLRKGWTSKLMGWPCHYRTDNTSPGPDWLDVFTFGSDDDVAWSWCDGQHLDVYIHKDGVESGTFAPFYGYAA